MPREGAELGENIQKGKAENALGRVLAVHPIKDCFKNGVITFPNLKPKNGKTARSTSRKLTPIVSQKQF